VIGTLLALSMVTGPTLPESLRAAMHTVRPAPAFDAWAVPVAKDAPAHPRATVYRWWTDSCPWCTQSLPALEQVRKNAEPAGVRMIAVYHPKPPRMVDPAQVAAWAKAKGWHGPVVIDQDWSELEKLAGPLKGLSATSVTLVLDVQRRLQHAHAGPVLFPSEKPQDAGPNADFLAMQQALERFFTPDGQSRLDNSPAGPILEVDHNSGPREASREEPCIPPSQQL